MNIAQVILENFRQRGAGAALTFVRNTGAEDVSGEQMLSMICLAQACIKDRLRDNPRGVVGAEPVVVPIIATHEPAALALFLACIGLGLCPTFMPYPSLKQDRALYWKSHAALFSRIDPVIIFGNAEIVAEALSGAADTGVADFPWVEFPSLDGVVNEGPPNSAPGGDAVALLQHSSGTTSQKKGVMLSHAQILAQVENYASALSITREARVVSWLPLYHDMGLIACFLTPGILGCPIVMLDPFEWVARPHGILEHLSRYENSYAWMPNFAFDHIARFPLKKSFDLSGVKALISCSEVTKAATLERFSRKVLGQETLDPRLQVCYALAENVFAVSQTTLGRSVRVEEGVVSCGPVLSSVSVRIVADSGLDAVERGRGEIWLKGPCVTPGYFRRPDLNEIRFVDGWFRTNDIGFMSEGELFILGRKDDMIISYGRNYFAHELEAIASEVPGVRPGRVVAFGAPREELGTDVIVMLYEGDGSKQSSLVQPAIAEAVNNQSSATPWRVQEVPRDTLYKTTSGKVSRELNKAGWLAGEFNKRVEVV